MSGISTNDCPITAAPVILVPTGEKHAPADVADRAERQLDELEKRWDRIAASEDFVVQDLEFEVPAGFTLSVVIPVFNEKVTILEIIARVHALPVDTEIIVVDDCSTDGTRGWLEGLRGAPGLKLLFHPENAGKGAALRAGFAVATGDVVVIQDADLEYDPRDILSVVRPIVAGEADVVYGSRFLGDEPQDESFVHRFGNGLLTRTSNFFTGLQLTDMETCYKAFRRDVLNGLTLKQNRFGFEPEVTAKLARRRCRIIERPIRYNARGYGQGKKIGMFDLFNALYCIVRYGLRD
ncbi:MAG: glycosyltransferase family 2 protein [Pirellulaceae bacterium]